MYITYTEASRKFEVSKTTILNWVKTGRLKSGPNVGKAKTVTSESANALFEDPNFMKGLEISKQKTTKLSKVEALEVRLNSLEREIIDLREFKDKVISLLSNDNLHKLTTINDHSKKLTLSTTTKNPPDKKESSPLSSFEKEKKFIEESISMGIPKSQICPAGKGTALGKWLRGETSPLQKSVEKWYKKAQELREKLKTT